MVTSAAKIQSESADKNGEPIEIAMNLSRSLLLKLLYSLLLGAGVSQPVWAAYYVYQLPDGSRLITDRKYTSKSHKLVSKTRDVKDVGKKIAGQTDPYLGSRRKRFDPLITEVAHRHDMDPALIKAVVHTESYFNPNATSHAGASGLMQLMPKTAEIYGISDLYSPHQNLDAGVRHLRYLLKKYKNRLGTALAAYNAGESAVFYYNGVPPYRETRRYIQKVLQYQRYYQQQP